MYSRDQLNWPFGAMSAEATDAEIEESEHCVICTWLSGNIIGDLKSHTVQLLKPYFQQVGTLCLMAPSPRSCPAATFSTLCGSQHVQAADVHIRCHHMYLTVLCITSHYHVLPCTTRQYLTLPCITTHYHALPCITLYIYIIFHYTLLYSTLQNKCPCLPTCFKS